MRRFNQLSHRATDCQNLSANYLLKNFDVIKFWFRFKWKAQNFYCLLDPSPFWILAWWSFCERNIEANVRVKIPGKYTITLNYRNLFNEMIHFDHDSLSTFMRVTHLWQMYLVSPFCHPSIANWKGSIGCAVDNSCWWQLMFVHHFCFRSYGNFQNSNLNGL